jgi:hypothetical protein
LHRHAWNSTSTLDVRSKLTTTIPTTRLDILLSKGASFSTPQAPGHSAWENPTMHVTWPSQLYKGSQAFLHRHIENIFQ